MPGRGGARIGPAGGPRAAGVTAVTALGAAAAAGIVLGHAGPTGPTPSGGPWLLAAALAALGGLALRRQRRASLLALAAAGGLTAAAWIIVRERWIATDDLAALAPPAASVVRLRGIVLDGPRPVATPVAPLAPFHHRGPVARCSVRVTHLIGRNGCWHPARGRLETRVEGGMPVFAPGALIEARGVLHPPSAPRNPGARDRRPAAAVAGRAGTLVVPHPRLLEIHEPRGRATLALRDQLRVRAAETLDAALRGAGPPASSRDRRALARALVLGLRDETSRDLEAAFRRVGIAHLLAISGLHLGVLVAAVLLVVRWCGHPRRWHGAVPVVIVLGYLLLVETRLPVLRAGAMMLAAAAGVLVGRRWRLDALVSASALALLAWRPDHLFDPGFQLSYGVVLGLVLLAARLRRRWFGPSDPLAPTVARMLGHRLADLLAAGVVAWAVSAPLVVHHFGTISPWTVLLGIIALPAVVAVLGAGLLTIVVGSLVPIAARGAGLVAALGAAGLCAAVRVVDAVPASVVHVMRPGVTWTLLATAWTALGCHGLARRHRRRRWCWWAAGCCLAAWLAAPEVAPAPPLRLDMLAVGDGSCYVVRSTGRTLLFDAGSAADPDPGPRTIVPALRALGVRRIDALVISHANLDHYNGVLAVVDAFPTGRVFVPPSLRRTAVRAPAGPVGVLLRELDAARVPVRTATRGTHLRLGATTARWLHPGPDDRPDRANDASAVLAFAVAGRSLLLTGDIETRGIEQLLARETAIRADVMELPHHGSANESARDLVRRLKPRIVLQSTGAARWRDDGWRGTIGEATRLVTARDGACWVEIDADGEMRTGRTIDGAAD